MCGTIFLISTVYIFWDKAHDKNGILPPSLMPEILKSVEARFLYYDENKV